MRPESVGISARLLPSLASGRRYPSSSWVKHAAITVWLQTRSNEPSVEETFPDSPTDKWTRISHFSSSMDHWAEAGLWKTCWLVGGWSGIPSAFTGLAKLPEQNALVQLILPFNPCRWPSEVKQQCFQAFRHCSLALESLHLPRRWTWRTNAPSMGFFWVTFVLAGIKLTLTR